MSLNLAWLFLNPGNSWWSNCIAASEAEWKQKEFQNNSYYNPLILLELTLATDLGPANGITFTKHPKFSSQPLQYSEIELRNSEWIFLPGNLEQ
jgi:hypothetical protein